MVFGPGGEGVRHLSLIHPLPVADDIATLNRDRVMVAATAAALVHDKVDLHQHLGIY